MPLILPAAAGGQKNPFQKGYLSLHMPDMQVEFPRPMMQPDPVGHLSKQHLNEIEYRVNSVSKLYVAT